MLINSCSFNSGMSKSTSSTGKLSAACESSVIGYSTYGCIGGMLSMIDPSHK